MLWREGRYEVSGPAPAFEDEDEREKEGGSGWEPIAEN